MGAHLVDILAVGFFMLEWTVYTVTLEHSAYGKDSLSGRMHVCREVWIRHMLERHVWSTCGDTLKDQLSLPDLASRGDGGWLRRVLRIACR